MGSVHKRGAACIANTRSERQRVGCTHELGARNYGEGGTARSSTISSTVPGSICPTMARAALLACLPPCECTSRDGAPATSHD
jgi:hypothetical protein